MIIFIRKWSPMIYREEWKPCFVALTCSHRVGAWVSEPMVSSDPCLKTGLFKHRRTKTRVTLFRTDRSYFSFFWIAMDNFCSKCEAILYRGPVCECGQNNSSRPTEPSTIRIWFNKRKELSQVDEVKADGPKVEKYCNRCSALTLQTYFTAQLRSADEGQTVFYRCTKCLIQTSENSWFKPIVSLMCLVIVWLRDLAIMGEKPLKRPFSSCLRFKLGICFFANNLCLASID